MNSNPEKERVWLEKLQAVDKLADGLGLGVDEGIKQTVAAFHLFDIHTTGSHEGKMDRYAIPYIDVESPDSYELNRKIKTLEGKEGEEKQMQENIREEVFRLNLEERKKVIPLLEEFYAERKVPYEIRLHIRQMARGWSRIKSQGADFQEVEKDEGKKRQRLQDFQTEMVAFTEFLKTKFFAGE